MPCPKHGQYRIAPLLFTFGILLTPMAFAATASPPEVVFGPKKFNAKLGNPQPQTATFSVAKPELSPGRLVIQNGKYPAPTLEKCPALTKKNVLAVALCVARNAAKTLEVVLTRPKNIQIELNGVVVVKESDFCTRTPILVVSVPLKATNTLKVLLKGLPTQYVVVSIDRTQVANQAPLADFTATPGPNADPLNYSFNGSASKDPDGTIANYSYDFGDETPAVAGQTVSHRYEATGTYNVVLTVTDNKGAQNSKVKQVVVQDVRAPQITVTQPLAGAALTSRSIQIAGSADEALREATANGQSLTLSSDKKQFSGSYQVSSDGPFTLNIQVKDVAGNASSVTRTGTVTTVTNLPPVARFSITQPPGFAPVTVMFDASASTDPEAQALTYEWNFGDGEVGTGKLVSHEFVNAGSYSITLKVKDIGGATATESKSIQVNNPPPVTDPKDVAPVLSSTTLTLPSDQWKFLYTGPNAFQTGVTAGAIKDERSTLLRGRTLGPDDKSLPGVTVTAVGNTELGKTMTQPDGEFDFVVNGGGQIRLRFERSGYLPIERVVATSSNEARNMGDVFMIRPDEKVTKIDNNSTTLQVVQGSTINDKDGQRTATLLIPAQTEAKVQLPNGTMQTLPSLQLRVTEYTVGDNGLKRMPAALPLTSAYTYAAEVNADEALALGSRHIEFSKPVPIYIENFLNVPVGSAVPLGTYNEVKGVWEAQPDGVILKILNVNGGVAQISVLKDLTPATPQQLTALGMGTEELTKLASLYPAGKELTRVSLKRFSPFDANYVQALTPTEIAKERPYPESPDPLQSPCSQTKTNGCVISLMDRNVSEDLELVGVPFSLHYDTARTAGNLSDKQIKIPLIPKNGGFGRIDAIKVDIEIAGRIFTQIHHQIRNGLSADFVWDGKDHLDRDIGSAVAQVSITYKYDILSMFVDLWSISPTSSFGSAVGDVGPTMSVVPARNGGEETANAYRVKLGRASNPGYLRQAFGGWTPSIHHAYDPVTRSLLLGSGQSHYSTDSASIVSTFAGNGAAGFSGDNGPALQAQFNQIGALAKGPDGSVYVVDNGNFRIRKISPEGIITTVVGTGEAGDSGDGGFATQAKIRGSGKPAIGPDGTLYFADSVSQRVRKVSPLGIITTVAGLGYNGVAPDGAVAAQSPVSQPQDVALDPQGLLYFKEGTNIRRVLSNGLLSTFLRGIPAPFAFQRNGEFYYGGVQRYTTQIDSGTFGTTVYRNGPVASFDVNDGGEIAILSNKRLVRGGNSEITGLFGQLLTGTANTSVPYEDYTVKRAWDAQFSNPVSLIWLDDGSILIADRGANKIRKYSSVLPGYNANGYTIPSEDGRELYQFSAQGTHLKTLFAKTGATKWTFSYNSFGALVKVTDYAGLETVIARSSDGKPLSVTGPYGSVTSLSTDGNGYLSQITNPNNETVVIGYSDSGLITSFKKPRGGTTTYAYDNVGYLIQETNALGQTQTLEHTENVASASSQKGNTQINILTSPLGRKTRVRMDYAVAVSGGETVAGEGRMIDVYDSENDSYPTHILSLKEGYIEQSFFGSQLTIGETSQVDSRLGGLSSFVGVQNIRRSNSTSMQTTTRTYASTGPSFFDFTMNEKTLLNDKPWQQIYDSSTKMMTSISPKGRQSQTKIDQFERPIESRVGTLNPIALSYDGIGRISSVAVADRSTQFSYNSRGQLSTVTDALGRVTSYEYDLAGRMIKQSLPGGRDLFVSYDKDGNVSGITPPGRTIHQTVSDLLGQLTGYLSPPISGQSPQTSYAYDSDQQLKTKSLPSGSMLTYNYDQQGTAKNLPVKLEFDGNEINYTYMADHPNTITASSPAFSEYAQDYHLFDGTLMTYKTTSLNYTNFPAASYQAVKFAYNPEGALATIGIDNTDPIAYAYDDDQLLLGTNHMSVSRSADHGLITGTSIGNVTATITRNGFGEPSAVETKYGSSTLLKETLARDKLGRIQSKTVQAAGGTKTYAYEYDLAGRLFRARVDSVLVGEYTYDLNGNRLSSNVRGQSSSATYDAQDRLVSRGPATFHYNANGEITQKTSGSSATNFTYNSLGQLKVIQLPNSDKISYQYDALGNRIVVNLNDQPVKKYIYSDKGQIIAEVNASGEMTQFIYVTQTHVPDYMIRGNALYRFVHDHLGSVRMVINASSGTISELVEYDEFGNVLSDTNPSFQPFRFAGCLYEQSTKLCRFGVRDYDPETGRWLSKDPILFNGGDTNLYGYVMNDPINLLDSTGLSARDVGRIRGRFNEMVDLMNRSGSRRPGSGRLNGGINNLMAQFNDAKNGFGSGYMGCADQAENVQDELTRLNFDLDDDWNFSLKFQGPFHFRVEGRSSNRSDPVLNIDPWLNYIGN